MMRRSLWFVLFAHVGACRSTTAPPREYVVETSAATYGPADTIAVTFANSGKIGVAYSPCYGVLEVLRQRWTAVGRAAGETVCIDVLFVLQPEAARSFQMLPAGVLAPGLYRFRFDFIYRSGILLPDGDRVSNSFEVLGP